MLFCRLNLFVDTKMYNLERLGLLIELFVVPFVSKSSSTNA